MPIASADNSRRVVVVILGGGRGARLDPLTRHRSKPAVPVAGKYRLIDIPISNSINSGMERMFVLTQYNSVSLHRHINRTYKFDPFSRGYVQILAAQQTPSNEGWFQGTADAVRQNLQIITESRGDLVLILSGDHIYRMDYGRMLEEHLERAADITIAVQPCTTEQISGFGAVRVDDTGEVLEFREKPGDASARAGMEVAARLLAERGVAADMPYMASMGIYLFRKSVLREALENDLKDFGHHVMPSAIGRWKVQSHFFNGYWRDIGTIRAFYDTHMDLIQAEPRFRFDDPEWQFFTHPRYLPAARITGSRFDMSLLAEGSVIEDSTITDSVIGVRTVMQKAEISRSLIMGADPYPVPGPTGAPPLGIGAGTVIRNAIVDKDVRIGRNVRIVNERGVEQDEGPGWVIRDGIVVIAKNAVLEDGTVI